MQWRESASLVVSCNDLSVQRIGSRRERQRVLEGLNLQLHRGEILQLLGATGSGKSTLAQLLSGTRVGKLRVVGGSARLNGRRLNGRSDARACSVAAYLPQRGAEFLAGHLLVSETVTGSPKSSYDEQVQVRVILEQMGLPLGIAERVYGELSSGMKQRVALASLLFSDQDLLVLDEPFAHLDPVSRARAIATVREYVAKKNQAVLILSNDRDLPGELAARTMVLNEGLVVAEGAVGSKLHWPSTVRSVL